MPLQHTIFCVIRHVQPAPTPSNDRMLVTLEGSQGESVTIVLDVDDLQTYERFQAAVLAETGCQFRYLPLGGTGQTDARLGVGAAPRQRHSRVHYAWRRLR